MLTTKGKQHPTIEDAATDFGVSTKTVHSWIKKGIIGKPPQVEYGLRLVYVFPESYMREARKRVAAHQQKDKSETARKAT